MDNPYKLLNRMETVRAWKKHSRGWAIFICVVTLAAWPQWFFIPLWAYVTLLLVLYLQAARVYRHQRGMIQEHPLYARGCLFYGLLVPFVVLIGLGLNLRGVSDWSGLAALVAVLMIAFFDKPIGISIEGVYQNALARAKQRRAEADAARQTERRNRWL